MTQIRGAQSSASAVLAGSLAAFPLLDVLGLLARTGHVGEVHIVGETVDDRLWVVDGQLLDQPERATARLFQLGRLPDAWFTVSGGNPPDAVAEVADRLPIEPLVASVGPQLAEWAALTRALPPDHIVRMSPTTSEEHVQITADQWRVLSLVGTEQSVRTVVDASHLAPLDALRLLRQLVDNQLLFVEPPSAPPVVTHAVMAPVATTADATAANTTPSATVASTSSSPPVVGDLSGSPDQAAFGAPAESTGASTPPAPAETTQSATAQPAPPQPAAPQPTAAHQPAAQQFAAPQLPPRQAAAPQPTAAHAAAAVATTDQSGTPAHAAAPSGTGSAHATGEGDGIDAASSSAHSKGTVARARTGAVSVTAEVLTEDPVEEAVQPPLAMDLMPPPLWPGQERSRRRSDASA